MSRIAPISLWMEAAGGELPNHQPLPGDRQFDVAIVGAGYTGLWTAWYLKNLAPELSVCILEAERVGFGASGRNGGWLMACLEGETELLSALPGERREQARAAIHSILPEVERVLAQTGIDCDYQRGGGLYAAARYPEQLDLQRSAIQALHACGHREDDYRWLEAAELASRLHIYRPLGGIYTPHIARIQPAKLALGLARAIADLGVDLFEGTPVRELAPEGLVCDHGMVRAGVRVLAMEGFGTDLAGHRRRVLPVQSRIVATEPLSAARWEEIGLADCEVFCDASPVVTYGQRSADGRLVFGARGSYRFGGLPRDDFSGEETAFDEVQRLLLDCLPQLEDAAISHCWGGTLGIPRGGTPHAVFDRASGLATAGGYFGEGVGASNLMARSLADLVLERDTALAAMPWSHRGHPQRVLRRWEPEPLRWLGYKLTESMRNLEESTYRSGAPAWQRGLVRRAAAMTRLI